MWQMVRADAIRLWLMIEPPNYSVYYTCKVVNSVITMLTHTCR